MCKLNPGPPGDAHGQDGATVFIQSGDDPMMAIQNADLNGAALPVVAGEVVLTPLKAGRNQLDIIVTSGETANEVVLFERCDDGTTKRLRRKTIGGGNDPHVGFDIRG